MKRPLVWLVDDLKSNRSKFRRDHRRSATVPANSPQRLSLTTPMAAKSNKILYPLFFPSSLRHA
jgi:hypothetical protein